MSKNLDHLVPKKIWDLLSMDQFDLQIKLQCHEFDNRWPKIRITVDGEVVYDGEAVDSFEFNFGKQLPANQDTCNILLTYYDKLDTDTLMQDGVIVANQGIDVKYIAINGIDIVSNKLMFELGKFTMDLSPRKKLIFKKLGISTEPSTTLGLYENGTWDLDINTPILSHFSKLQSRVEVVESGPWEDLIAEIYERAETCTRLEKNQKLTGLPR